MVSVGRHLRVQLDRAGMETLVNQIARGLPVSGGWRAVRSIIDWPVPLIRDRAVIRDYGEVLLSSRSRQTAKLRQRIREWVGVADNELRNYRFISLKSQAGQAIDLAEYAGCKRIYNLITLLQEKIHLARLGSLEFFQFLGLPAEPAAGIIVTIQ